MILVGLLMRLACAAMFIASLCCADGCTGVSRSVDPSLGATAEIPELDPSFKPGDLLLRGFDEPQLAAPGECEDWVLLGVKVTRTVEGKLHDDVWFVRLTTQTNTATDDPATPSAAAAPSLPATPNVREFSLPFTIGPARTGMKFAAPFTRVRVETYDCDGVFLRSSLRSVPACAPRVSMLDVCRMLDSAAAGAQDSNPRRSAAFDAGDIAGLITTLRSLTSAGSLTPIRAALRQDICRSPTLLDLIFNGLRVNIQTQLTEVDTVMSPWSIDAPLSPAYQARFPLIVAGQCVLECRMIVGPPLPPYQLTGGVLLLDASHPDRPENRVTARVLAAKRIAARP